MGLTQGRVPTGDPSKLSKRRQRMPTAVVLPAGGRKGRTPKWPLVGDRPTPDELTIWHDLWRTPQATVWERLEWTRDVALFARMRARLEAAPSAALAAEVRQIGDRLGLNPLAMQRLRWTISEDEVAQRRRVAKKAAGDATRDRLRQVD